MNEPVTRSLERDNLGRSPFAASLTSSERSSLTAIGLMSGTSMDGIDAAVLTTDGETISDLGAFATFPYPAAFRDRLREMLGRETGPDDAAMIAELTHRHAEAVGRLLDAAGLPPAAIDVVGFHGHTVVHRPEVNITRQIGDGQLLADVTGIPVVNDFRSADVAAGGHGAPFAPLYHLARARDLERPLCVLNVGGVANVTWIGEGDSDGGAGPKVIAFDTGPGNALVDDWVQRVSEQRWDEQGRLARSGQVHSTLIDAWLADPYFDELPPKSLDRNSYARIMEDVRSLSAEDGAATLTAFTVAAIAASQRFFPDHPARWLVCGGGRCNVTLMAMLADSVGASVEPVEAVGWDGDGLEAQAFAFLAVRSVYGLPLSVPTTTGVPDAMTGGVLSYPTGGSGHAGAVVRARSM